ncbi:MAG: Gfo/Idh/MocA family protein [Planctomycetota bacterium]
MTAQNNRTTPSTPLRCGVVGVGRMGRHHARVYATALSDVATLVGVVDSDHERAAGIATTYESQAFESVEAMIDAGVDAVTVATPTQFHYDCCEPLLKAGVACLVEKPLAPNVREARQIADLARSTGSILQVGHIERYNPAVRAVVDRRDLKLQPRFIEVHRVSPMSFRSLDVGVVLDMMIHDLDVLLMLTGEEPNEINACAVGVLGLSEDVCNARLSFPSGCVANVTASRLALKTERKTRIIAEDAYISIDYAKKSGVMILRTANEGQLAELQQQIESGTDLSDLDYTDLVQVEPLDIDDTDQLERQLRTFLSAVTDGTQPEIDAEAGFAAVRTAERIVAAADAHRTRIGR